ncbi:MAG: hypothetical protein K8R87_12170 [Verrucomicrobia bacterium]|nr:hypothetical protein [Verrucomicrobiota bacterium]
MPLNTAKAGLPPGNFTRSTPSVTQEPAPERKRRRVSSSESGRRWGALVGALFFIGTALAGAGWFFKDQVKVYWNSAMARFQKSDAPDSGGVDPAVAALLNQVKTPTQPGAAKNIAVAKDPAAVKKTTDTNAAAANTTVKIPTPPAPNGSGEMPGSPKSLVEVTPATAGSNAGSLLSQTAEEMTKKPEIPVATLVEPPGSGKANPPAVSSDPPVKKALPVEPDDASKKPRNYIAPETIAPIPPAPGSSSNPALVEVPPSEKGRPAAATLGDEKPVYIKASGEAKPAAEILNKFFQAKTWQERLLYTQPQEKVRPLMERYYADNPDGPLRVSSIELIRHDKSPEIGTPLCVFQVSGPDLPEPLPVMVESSPEGWKVDWLTLTEFKDKLLLRFLQKWQDEPARFHVMVRRTHYFDEDVPNLDKKHCFELMPPTPGYSGYAFIPKGSPLALNLDRSIGWEVANLAAIVELRWRKQDRYQWVEITAVPQFNWRSTLPANSIAQPAKVAPESSSDIMPAKPATAARLPAVAEKK